MFLKYNTICKLIISYLLLNKFLRETKESKWKSIKDYVRKWLQIWFNSHLLNIEDDAIDLSKL